jgi:hypothetical protein
VALRNKKFTKSEEKKILDQYLAQLTLIEEHNHVNPLQTDDEREKVKKRFKYDFNFFVQECFPHYYKYPLADFHIYEANYCLRNRHSYRVVAWGRGLAKSVIFNIMIPLWLHLVHEIPNFVMLVIGANKISAKRLLADLQAECKANPQLRHYFGDMYQHGSWEEGDFRTKTGLAAFAIGKGSSPRGARVGPYRPIYINMDDVDETDECENPIQVNKRVKWVKQALIPCFDKENAWFRVTNNIIGEHTITTELIKTKGFTSVIQEACDDDLNPVWGYTKEYLELQRQVMGTISFDQEYRGIAGIEGKIFTDNMIIWQKALRLNSYSRIIGFWDVAYSESKTADTNAVVIAGLVGHEIHVLKAFCANCTPATVYKWMHAINDRLPKTVIIEWYMESQFWNDAMSIIKDNVEKSLGKHLPIIVTSRPGRGTNKYSRIIQMLPAFQIGSIKFSEAEKNSPDMARGLRQLKGIEPGYTGKDDFPDALCEVVALFQNQQVSSNHTPTTGANNDKKYNY